MLRALELFSTLCNTPYCRMYASQILFVLLHLFVLLNGSAAEETSYQISGYERYVANRALASFGQVITQNTGIALNKLDQVVTAVDGVAAELAGLRNGIVTNVTVVTNSNGTEAILETLNEIKSYVINTTSSVKLLERIDSTLIGIFDALTSNASNGTLLGRLVGLQDTVGDGLHNLQQIVGYDVIPTPSSN